MLKHVMRRSLLTALCASTVIAQQISAAPADSNEEPASADTVRVEEVLVTAQRRDEEISKVPISMSAFSQDTLDALDVGSVADLAGIVPGLLIPHPDTTNNANSAIAIRGIFSGGNTPTTQLYIDETPIAIREMRQGGPSGSFFPTVFDLERVEVLRGPQGTLFGSSAMGGAIRFITPQPNLKQSSGYAKAEFGSTERGDPSYAAGVAYGAPIIEDKLGFRASAWYNIDGGYVDNVDPYTQQTVARNSNDATAFAGRAALGYVPTEHLTITPAVFFQRQRLDNLAAVWMRPYLGNEVSGDSPSQPSDDKMVLPSLALEYEFAGMTFQSDTSYLKRDFNTYDDTTQLMPAIFDNQILVTPPSFRITQNQFGGTRAWQQQFRLTSTGDSKLQWVVGAYFRHAEETLDQRLTPELTPMTQALYGVTSQAFFGLPAYVRDGVAYQQYTTFETTDEQRSLFGDVGYRITERLKLNVGVRVERSIVKDQTQFLAGPFGGSALGRVIVLPNEEATPVNPRASLAYQYNDQHLVYASAAKGYRSGGANLAANLTRPSCVAVLQSLGIEGTPVTFDSDSLWSYEVGAKDMLFDGRLSLQTSVFRIDWKDIQTAFNEQGCSTFTINRGEATVNGAEMQFAVVPLDGLKLGGNVSYVDAAYDKPAYGVPQNGVPRLIYGKDKLARVLPWTAALNAEFLWNAGALWSGAQPYIRADYRWQDQAPAGNPLAAGYNPYRDQYRDPAFNELNIRIGVKRDSLDISAFINNATNSSPLLGFSEVGTGGPDYPLAYRGVIRPRTIGVTGLYRF